MERRHSIFRSIPSEYEENISRTMEHFHTHPKYLCSYQESVIFRFNNICVYDN